MSKASDFFAGGGGTWLPTSNNQQDVLDVVWESGTGWQTVSDLIGPVMISQAGLEISARNPAVTAEIRMTVNGVLIPLTSMTGRTSTSSTITDIINFFGRFEGAYSASSNYSTPQVFCKDSFKLEVRQTTSAAGTFSIVHGTCGYAYGDIV